VIKERYKPDVNIDPETEALLFEAYECLRAPLMAELTGSKGDESEIFDRAAAIFSRLQEKLGECFDQEAYIPTSAELGFDVTQSIFEVGVSQRLEQIASVIADGQPPLVASTLQAQSEVFLGLAESLNLPGFGAIATSAIDALAKHPESSVAIAQAALADFQQGQAAVLSGDRTSGGQPSLLLQQLAEGEFRAGEAGEADLLLDAIWTIPESQEDLPSTNESELGMPSDLLAVETDLYSQRQTSEATPMPNKDAFPVANTVRVNIEHLERLNYLIGELLTNQTRQSLQDEKLQGGIQELFSQLQQHQQMLDHLNDYIARLEPESHNELYVLMQSLLDRTEQLQAATDTIDSFSRQSSQLLEKQSRLLNSTRDDFLAARMIHLGNVFSRLPRVLQQLETLHNKPVALKLSGTEVLVDKAVAKKLYEPLLHLIRNAFDHGIEPIEVRQLIGKTKTGQIEIRAFHQGSHLMIEVRDDGQGLNFEQIRQRAVEVNQVSPEQAIHLNEAQLIDLLFELGFSTARQVNNLSGRGIGLDVVRAQLQALQGAITVYSELNRGTTFLLQIPFSLTMAKLLLFQVGSIVYALLTDAIEQILVPQPSQLRSWEGGKVLKWSKGSDEQLVPVCKLEQVLNYFSPFTAPSAQESTNRNLFATTEQMGRLILLRCGDKLLALEVDQIITEQELVIRPLEPMIVPPRYIYGGSILADGQLTLVMDGVALAKYVLDKLNNDALMALAQSTYTDSTYVSFTPPIPSSNSLNPQHSSGLNPEAREMLGAKVLLVDDSLTLRQNLALTLQKFGYQVFQADDGYEAIAQLRSQPDIHLAICDLEMPHMNGFEFLNYRRQDPAIAKIPVIVLTSRTGEKHRLLALELGATTYMQKPYLEQELLATVGDLLQTNRLNWIN
jgi:chemotaxis protein histidine kinase CheA/ActR/RegA family two-component response regulator